MKYGKRTFRSIFFRKSAQNGKVTNSPLYQLLNLNISPETYPLPASITMDVFRTVPFHLVNPLFLKKSIGCAMSHVLEAILRGSRCLPLCFRGTI